MKLTEEQKEHFREADRQNGIVKLTWQLFTMFLSEDKRPAAALKLAQEAMELWQDFDDANWMEPPEVDQPDFQDQMQALLVQFQPLIMEALKSRPRVMPPGWPADALTGRGPIIFPSGPTLPPLSETFISMGAARFAAAASEIARRAFTKAAGISDTHPETANFETSYQRAMVDAYRTGAIEAQKMLHGDFSPVPWTDDSSSAHEATTQVASTTQTNEEKS